jgi:SAM-dependent methyltransferase
MPPPADWQLPPGISRGVWDYLHDSTTARRYDESLAGTPLLDVDRQFVERHCSPPGRVIDLGCGTARVGIPMAQRGHRVTGVDLSQEMLRAAGDKATAAGVRMDRVQANIVEMDGFRDGQFDYALCLFATLGMVFGMEARRRVLANAFRLLRPGGTLVLHVHARWHHLRTATGRRWLTGDCVRSALGRPGAGDWPMPHHNGQPGWVMHLFTRRELLRFVKAAGFETTEFLPISSTADARLRWPRLFPGLRAYGFLVAGRKPVAAESTGESRPATLS